MRVNLLTHCLLVSVCVLALLGCSSKDDVTITANDSIATAQPFVRVDGRYFLRGNEPYYLVGVNFWYGGYLGATSDVGDRERLITELDLLKATGVNNLRVLALSEQSGLVNAVRPAIGDAAGNLDEQLLVGLDFLLAEMAKRDMTAVLYLNNFWQWSGGMSQYVEWDTGEQAIDPDKTGLWNDFIMNSARFYSLPSAQKTFKARIKKLIERTNTITGVAYKDDPTIMAWQLANEPRPGSDELGLQNADAYKIWIRKTASFIKQLAPKQLVSSGSEGYMGSARNWTLYKEAHDVREIDYLTFHMWPKNWSWYDSSRAEETYPVALENSIKYIDEHIDVANELGKPTVIEEFGLDRDSGLYTLDSTTVYRDNFFEAVFTRLTERAHQGDAIAGYNIWAWGGTARTTRDNFWWQEGDAFFGDPPQEPQGLYSVFDTDASTLSLMTKSAQQFKQAAQKR